MSWNPKKLVSIVSTRKNRLIQNVCKNDVWQNNVCKICICKMFSPFYLKLKKACKFFAGSISKYHMRIFICFVGYGNYLNDNFPSRPVIQQHWEVRKNVLGVKLVGNHSCYVVVVHLRVLHSLAHGVFFQTSLSSRLANKRRSQKKPL